MSYAWVGGVWEKISESLWADRERPGAGGETYRRKSMRPKPLMWKRPCASCGEVVCAIILVVLVVAGLVAFAWFAGRL